MSPLTNLAMLQSVSSNFSTHLLSNNLQQIRKQKYEEMVMTDCSHIDTSPLPPSSRAAYHQDPRAYHQIKVRRTLSDTDLVELGMANERSYVCTSNDRRGSRPTRYPENRQMWLQTFVR